MAELVVANSLAKVSIIIPHFNRGDLLLQTLKSVRDQSFVNWEAIVVDDGSVPEEWQKAQQFRDPRVRFVQRTDGIKGPSRCRNIGLQCSTGEYVVFVDSDDLLAPWCLAERVRNIELHPDAAFVVFPVMLFRVVPGDLATLWNRLEGDNDLERFLQSDPPWHTSSPIWRRQVVEKLAGFDEQVMYGDDADLHMRALFADTPYAKCCDALPDSFVRRAAEGRITNTMADCILESRIIRLQRGSVLVKSSGSVIHCDLWSGQFFAELEFLLFNVPDCSKWQSRVFAAWKEYMSPSVLHYYVVWMYLFVARHTLRRCYLMLRIARRIALLVLPKEFSPIGGRFETEPVSSDVLARVRCAY
jgi:glycosyltransferase involved in cell wall biosynthesis